MIRRMPRSPLAIALCCSAALPLLALLPAAAAAGPSLTIETAPTRGVTHLGAGIADGAEPAAVLLNPASLGELSGYTLGLRHTETAGDTPFTGRGTALYGAVAVPALPYLWFTGRIRLGAGLEVLRPPDGVAVTTTGKLTLALAYRLTPWLSAGLGYAHLFIPGTPAYDNLDTLDLGLRARLGRFVAAGLVLRDVTGPGAASGLPLQRVYEAELLARPLGDERLELAAGARLGERWLDVEPRARLWVRPARGVGLGAEGTVLANAPGLPLEWRVALGLTLDLQRVGASAFGLFGGASGADVGGPSGSVAVRFSQERYPSFLKRPDRRDHLAEVKLGELGSIGWLELLERLRRMEKERDVTGVLLDLRDGAPGDWAAADDLRDQLLRLRWAGKRIFAYGRGVSSRSYYVATAAEKIYLHPDGEVDVRGALISSVYVKGLLDRLGVRADFLYVGDYKSWHETFSRTGPSPADDEQRQALVDQRFERLRDAIAGRIGSGKSARVDRAARGAAVIDHGLYTPAEARAAGMVDALVQREDLEALLEKDLGRKPRLLPPEEVDERPRAWAPRVIAVVPISGELGGGGLLTGSPSAAAMEAAIKEAAGDPSVRAIVLRINSPGGSATAGEDLAQAVRLARKQKPVVCSFGGTAASAAYELAAGCDRIVAEPTTVTGSIGIFMPNVDASGLLQRLGVQSHVWARGKNAEAAPQVLWPAFRPLRPGEREVLMNGLRYSYGRFVDTVAEGRHLKREVVERLARGRVWTGAEAVKLGLCDQLGGLMDAVAVARERAHLGVGDVPGDDLKLRYYWPARRSLVNRLLGLGAASEDPGAGARQREDEAAGPILSQFDRLLLLLQREALHVYWGPT